LLLHRLPRPPGRSLINDNKGIAEQVLLVPDPVLGPVVETLPGLRGVLQDLRNFFDVEIFRWPDPAGEPAIAPTWQAAAEAIRQATLDRPVHVVTHLFATSLAVPGLSRDQTDARSLCAIGMGITTASLRAVGMPVMSRMFQDVSRELKVDVASLARYILRSLHGLDNTESDPLINQCVEGSNSDFIKGLGDSLGDLDLARERGLLPIPALLFRPPPAMTTLHEGEGIQLIQLFAPHAEVRQLKDWPKEPEGTGEVSGPIIKFIQRVAGKAGQGD
jgi:hypothetical protein